MPYQLVDGTCQPSTGVCETILVGHLPHVMPSSFKNDSCDSKPSVVELKYRPGRDDGLLTYIMPSKFLALERGGAERFLEETSFSSSGSDSLPSPPSPLVNFAIQALQEKVNSIESQLIQANHQMVQANRNIRCYGILSLVLMTLFLLAGLFCLLISPQLPFFMQLTKGSSEATGTGTDVDPVIQPNLSLGMVVLSETTTIPSPEDFNVGVAENGTLLILNFTPLGGEKA